MTHGLIDSHCHLSDPKFNGDREAVIARAREAGLSHIMSVGGGGPIETSEAAAELARKHDFIRSSAGMHPHDAKTWNDEIAARVEALLECDEVTAVGETGLDFHYNLSQAADQKRVLAIHIALAKKYAKPIVIHCRNAEAELFEILASEAPGGLPGVMHCYTGNYENAVRFVDYGFLVSFSGILTFKTAGELREVAAKLPLDRLMVETDSPYLAPEPHRGKRNEPAFVVRTAEVLAEVHGVTFDAVAEATRANTLKIFFPGKA